MRWGSVCFLFFLCCILSSSIAFGEAEYHVVSNQLPPLRYDDNGRTRGISVDILADLMEKVGTPISVEEIESMSWARAYEDALTIPGTIILSMARTTAREDLFKWVGPIYSIQLGLIGRKNMNFSIDKASDAAKYRVGALRDTAPAQLLVRQGFPADKLHHLARTEQALQMLKEGRIDLFAHTADSSFYMMPLLGMDPSKYEIYYVIREDIPLYIGLHKEFDDDLVARLQAELDAFKVAEPGEESMYEAIVHKYVRDRFFVK
ncbi:MAG: transporter substrate-binding domain-containing protein [Pseudodesulfovibrio sp.]